MFNLIKKDFLTLTKTKSELIEILLTPFFLISILGFALGNLIGDTTAAPEQTTIGFVDETVSTNDLKSQLIANGLVVQEADQVIDDWNNIDPIVQLQAVFDDESLQALFKLESYESASEARQALGDDEIGGLIIIPESFSLDLVKNTFLEEDPSAEIEVITQDPSQIRAITLKSVMISFAQEYNFQASVVPVTGELVVDDEETYGEIINIATEEPISSFEYYTLGMAVFFALGISTIIASRSYREKETHVFARIMVAGYSPMHYLMSKLISSAIIALVQLGILFSLSNLLFDTFSGRLPSFWIGIVCVSVIYSILIGSLSSLLTAISLNAEDSVAVSFYGSFTSVLAFLGGSFFPTDQFSTFIKLLGDWTPNGAAMTSYLQLLMGFEMIDIMPYLSRIIGMSIIFVFAAILLFPSRRLD